MYLALSQAEGSWESGVNPNSMVAHARSIWVEALRLALEVDPIDNISNCRSLELIARRFIVDEWAVARCPTSPGYAGLDLIFSAPTSEQGQAATTRFTEWMASKWKERGRITKQQRLSVEEDRLGRKKRGKGLGKGQGDDDDDEHPERRRAKPRPKVKAKEE